MEDTLADQAYAAASQGNCDWLTKLIREGYDVNKLDESGHTLLFCAVINGHIDAARILLEAGADPNVYDKTTNGFTPITFIAESMTCEMATLLLNYGADPSVRTWMGINAIEIARRRGEDNPVFQLLVSWKQEKKNR